MNPIFSVEQTPSNPLRSPEVPHYKPGQFVPLCRYQQLMKRSFIKTIVVQMTGLNLIIIPSSPSHLTLLSPDTPRRSSLFLPDQMLTDVWRFR